MYDLVIRNGKIVDGSGQPSFMGDIAIQNDRIVKIGLVEESGNKEIDAEGNLVTPGWVDIHTHYDGQVCWDEYLTPSCWHGVTTVVMGNCGVGFAPVKPGTEQFLVQLMEGVEDIPGVALNEGVSWDWESFPEYLDSIEKNNYAMDIGAMIGHGPIRSYVMGMDRCQGKEEASKWIQSNYGPFDDKELFHRLSRYGLNPCGEILGSDFHCNLAEIHLNQIDPLDINQQEDAFKAAALSVACLLNHRFEVERYRKSREWDPIVGVSFTGLFDFFVHAFGTPWLKWWEAGRPETKEGKDFKLKEATFLSRWRKIVNDTVFEYCDRQNIRRPSRCTTVQPAGTKSLLTGASPGWHPPKAQRFIRRITFRKNDPVALACMDYGYTIVPSQSDKDENGKLLDNPFDPKCTEWLVEIPTEVSWANIPGADQIDINNFSALAQFDFYMQVQTNYTDHNTSATIEFRENEIEGLAKALHSSINENKGYISAALLARFDANATFPRLPFDPIDEECYTKMQSEVIKRRDNCDFFEALSRYDQGELTEAGPAGCDSDKCLLPLAKPS